MMDENGNNVIALNSPIFNAEISHDFNGNKSSLLT